uniref:Uncharacterized protein n=1 Tax=Arundo donax TaxID=35708 RepID=A0A0A9A3M4_ARUDO
MALPRRLRMSQLRFLDLVQRWQLEKKNRDVGEQDM